MKLALIATIALLTLIGCATPGTMLASIPCDSNNCGKIPK